MFSAQDKQFMQRALALACKAQEQGEVPVGAVLVNDNQIVGEGWNQSIANCDPSAHAEMIAIREAATACQNYRLLGSTLYVTLEPCAMCAGAMIHARIQRLVYATKDPRTGAAGSVFQLLQSPHLNHAVEISAGLFADEAKQLLQQFFQAKRRAC
jgi:tRNA(adenine34) deaminase